VSTPHLQRVWKKRKYAGFPKGTEEVKALFLAAVRGGGVGQGDAGSPINWDFLYDILLCALTKAKDD